MMNNNKKITIALDCMGGDNAPKAVVEGMVLASRDYKEDVDFVLFGKKEEIEAILKRKRPASNYRIVDTNVVISPEEKPSVAIRRGRDSSMGLAIQAVKDKVADASISSGNTGALMALSKIILRTLPDIDRPALIQMIPNGKGFCTALLDMGANIECDSINLYQFAIMGKVFVNALTNRKDIKIGLLNIGSEEIKGNDSIKNAANMLKNSKLRDNFYGYIEGDDIMTGKVDVVVSDGFSGNIALKSIEGLTKVLVKFLKKIYMSNIFTLLGYFLVHRKFKKLKQTINPEIHNGAMLIGLNGISIKSHGNSNARSFYFAIKNTVNLVKNDINTKITKLVNDLDLLEEYKE